MFFKIKNCRNKLHIYTEVEVHIAKQDPVELIELRFHVLETSIFESLNEQKYHTRKSVVTNESRNNRTKAILKSVKRKGREYNEGCQNRARCIH